MTENASISPGLKLLFRIHGFITMIAAAVLIFFPAVIPHAAGFELLPGQYLLCYLLGAAELGIAFLSFAAPSVNDKKAIRLIATSFIIFHLATAVLEAVAVFQQWRVEVIINLLMRLLIAFLFWYYGFYRNKN
jgi:hypothetical protein